MKKSLMPATLLTLVLALCLPAAASAITLSFSPESQSGNIGDTFTVDIIVGDIAANEAVGSYDLDITFNNTILSGQTITLGNGLGDPTVLEGLTLAGHSFSGNKANLFETSLEDFATLQGLQGSSFTLATLTFKGEANGLSFLTFSSILFGDENGDEMEVSATRGVIQVGEVEPHPAPEPASLTLLLGGSLITALRLRRRR